MKDPLLGDVIVGTEVEIGGVTAVCEDDIHTTIACSRAVTQDSGHTGKHARYQELHLYCRSLILRI
jgi:hypothetical protein